MKRSYFFLISIITMSCAVNHDSSFLKKCIEEKADGYVQESTNEDSYYHMLRTFEELMIEEGVLEGRGKSAYLHFIDGLSGNSEATNHFYEDQPEMIHAYSGVSGLIMMHVLFTCPGELVRADSTNISLKQEWNNRLTLADQLSASGYQDAPIFKAYINSFSDAQFEDIVYRGSVINIVIFLLERQYNTEIDYKDSVKIYGQ